MVLLRGMTEMAQHPGLHTAAEHAAAHQHVLDDELLLGLTYEGDAHEPVVTVLVRDERHVGIHPLRDGMQPLRGEVELVGLVRHLQHPSTLLLVHQSRLHLQLQRLDELLERARRGDLIRVKVRGRVRVRVMAKVR